MSLFALAVAGAFVASAGAHAAEADKSPQPMLHLAALVGPVIQIGTVADQREVIQPPSSIDPGMSLDPPDTGGKMPIIHPPGTPGGKLVLPR
ncbi:MAG TPA: hypothetical protein VMB84_01470 [Stellaceae bacterium]|nr:hypothetical protein [Stellaceae bacterium]